MVSLVFVQQWGASESESSRRFHHSASNRPEDLEHITQKILTHALNYGSSIFEGQRLYLDQEKFKDGFIELALVNGTQNARRFRKSAMTLGLIDNPNIHRFDLPPEVASRLAPYNSTGDIVLPPTFTEEYFLATEKEYIQEAIALGLMDPTCEMNYLRPLMFRAGPSLGVFSRQNKIQEHITHLVWKGYLPDDGMNLVVFPKPIADRLRSEAKTAASYFRGTEAKDWAKKFPSTAGDVGFDDALFYYEHDGEKCLAEGTGMNTFIFLDRYTLVTPPVDTAPVLPGITRDITIKAARNLGLDVIERHITLDEAQSAQAVYCTGTATGIEPVGMMYNPLSGERGRASLFYINYEAGKKLQQEVQTILRGGTLLAEANKPLQDEARSVVVYTAQR